MLFEIKNEEQAMDVLEYITRNDYDFETGRSASEIIAESQAKNELDYIKEYFYADSLMRDYDENLFREYINITDKTEIDSYIIRQTINSSYIDVEYEYYEKPIQECIFCYMEEFLNNKKQKKEGNNG